MAKKWTLQDLRKEMENEANDLNVHDPRKHGATSDSSVLHNMQDHGAEHEMELKLQQSLSKPLTNPAGSFFNHMNTLFIGLPCVTDWNDTDIGPRKCYNLFKIKKDRDIVALGDEIFDALSTNVTSRAMYKLMLLAYQLADDHGNECFGDVFRDLIAELVEFDDAKDETWMIPAKSTRLYVNVSYNDPNREFKVARAYSYLAASYMRLFVKPVANYQQIGNLLGNRFKGFYGFKFPFDDYHLSVDVISRIKTYFDFDVTLKKTFYNFLYAGEGSEFGDPLKEFLYRSHTAYTGMHAYILFLKCMQVHKVSNSSLAAILDYPGFKTELTAIAAIFSNLHETQGQRGKEKQMWKFARIFNNHFCSDLQTKKCSLFIASLAYLYHIVVPIKENENALNIGGIREMTVTMRDTAKAIARIANEKIHATQ